jgi:hypothetical protein
MVTFLFGIVSKAEAAWTTWKSPTAFCDTQIAYDVRL